MPSKKKTKKTAVKAKTAKKTKIVKKAKAKQENVVNPEMTFAELTSKFPGAVPILFDYGLHCIGCHVSALETIEQGAMAHGLTEEQLKQMIERINNSVKK